MTIGESLLPEFDNEMANTRKTLYTSPYDHASRCGPPQLRLEPHHSPPSSAWRVSASQQYPRAVIYGPSADENPFF
jgi:hypothetical protein